jgi:hypothetical protein
MAMRSLYEPRPYFLDYHLRTQRWALLVAHRRAGKTVAAINDTIEKATYNPRPNPRYAYIAPLYRQAKDIAWMYLKEYAAPFEPEIKESELSVTLRAMYNRPKITLYGADNPDSFRGLYLDGAVLDEYGNMKESVYKEVLLPALIDRRGWATFMGTPNGPNHFRDLHYHALDNLDRYHSSFLPVTRTGVISQEDLDEMKRIMDPEQYAQEMMCSFEASVRGAIYARDMELAEQEGRIDDFLHLIERGQQTHVVMDLGFRDDTSGMFWQDKPDGTLITHAFNFNLRPIAFYLAYLKEYWKKHGLKPGKIWLPHDARAKSLQTGRSIVEQFSLGGLKPAIVPSLDLMDGIAATRLMFPTTYFHAPETKQLVMALKSYHRKYDEDKKVFSDEPVHDWSSHYADGFRYKSIVGQKGRRIDVDPEMVKGMEKTVREIKMRQANYGFSLDQIWDLGPGFGHSGRI